MPVSSRLFVKCFQFLLFSFRAMSVYGNCEACCSHRHVKPGRQVDRRSCICTWSRGFCLIMTIQRELKCCERNADGIESRQSVTFTWLNKWWSDVVVTDVRCSRAETEMDS